MWAVFVDELVKIAVSVDQLRMAAKRIPGVLKPVKGSVISQFGALTVPTTKQLKSPSLSRMAKLQEEALGPDVSKYLEQQIGPVYKDPSMRGKLLVSKTVGKALDPTIKPSSRRARNLQAFSTLHEAAERSAVPAMGSAHASPSVLMNDKNLLSRLTGRGAEGVRRSMLPLRKHEFGLLQHQMENAFGPRASEFMGPRNKIPKAMRKAFIRSNPNMGVEQLRGIIKGQQESLISRLGRVSQ